MLRNHSLRRVKGWSADINHVFGQGRTVISRYTGTIEDTAEQMLGEGNLHRSAEETYRVVRADTLCTGKYLEGYEILIQLNYIRVTVTDQCEVSVSDALCTDGNDVTDDRLNFCIYFLHKTS